MCLILLAYQQHPHYPLIIAANRDEFHFRPTAIAHFWEDTPWVLAGRDLQAGGTWLGVTQQGRIAAITNYREPYKPPTSLSRGTLVSEFLQGHATETDYLKQCAEKSNNYLGFNLIVGNAWQLYYFSNRGHAIQAIAPGIHGLSNHLLDTPWPKVTRGKHALHALLSTPATVSAPALLALLNDRTPAPDAELPQTGVSPAWERLLSPLFIVNTTYGTRCSTVILVRRDGFIEFSERSFAATGEVINTVTFNCQNLDLTD